MTDYYPFGMEEPGRSYNSNTSRFGYTGHEKENDLAEGVYTTQYRLLDTRLGRWMSVDPLFGKYPDMSAYNYCGGNPVAFWDPDGREKHIEHREIPEHDIRWYANNYPYKTYAELRKQKFDDGKNTRLNASARLYPDNENVFHIFCHGNRNQVLLADNQYYNAEEFYLYIYNIDSELIKENIENKQTMVIFLHSCSTGDSDGWGSCFAEQLSKLGGEDFIVIAPSKSIVRNANGEEKVYNEGFFVNDGGYYNVFYKGQLIKKYGGYKESGTFEEWLGNDVGEAVYMPEVLQNFNIDEIKETYEKRNKEITPPTFDECMTD